MRKNVRKELCTQLDYYETQQQKIRQQMKTFYQYPKELGTLAKVCSSASIRLHCLGSADSHQIAKLMVEGTNMGLIQLSQLMNRHANLTDSVRKQGAEMMQQEEAYLNRLKPYL